MRAFLLMLYTYKVCPKCQMLRNVSEFGKNRSRADGLFLWCKLCTKTYNDSRKTQSKAWRERNRAHVAEQARLYHIANASKIRQRVKDWQRDNPERVAENRHRLREIHITRFRKYATDWVKRHPGKANEALARRRVAQFNATPGWADRRKTRAIYVEAARLTRETGVPHAVDHIVPLRSKIVCGLHWHGNLQILTKSDNSKKSNRYWPDMP